MADKDKNEDEITMEELRKVADSCIEMLKTEADCPSYHPELGYRVPILDLSVWVEKVELPAPWMDQAEGDLHKMCNDDEQCLPVGVPPVPTPEDEVEYAPKPSPRLVTQVLFKFYRKPMAPQRVMLSSSAQSWQQKRTTATQELMRRLLNTKKELSCKQKQKIISDYMQLLKNSNYNTIFRKEVLKSGLVGYNKILEAHLTGKRPIYRSSKWRKSSQGMEDQKLRKSKNWLGSYKSCIFVPPTPDSELQKLMQAKEKELRAGGRENLPKKLLKQQGSR